MAIGPSTAHRAPAARSRRLILVLTSAAVLLVGCQAPGPSQSPSPAAVATPTPAAPTAIPSSTPSPTAIPQPTPALVVDPLTGLPVSPAAARLPVIACMVDDHEAARPQSGFNAAGIVWQAPAEGGIPRYMLVFHATVPGQVGPIRSAREYFLEWAAEWGAMYCHAGGSPQALASLRANGSGAWVWNADEFAWGTYFRRVTFNVAPHNLYTDGTHLEALAARLGVDPAPPTGGWTFGPPAPIDARPTGGSIVAVFPYETVTFRYDKLTNTYRRYIDVARTAQVDPADRKLVAPTNVVVLRMSFGPLNDGEPYKHRLEANDVGSGVAWIATNGITVKGTWRKASVTSPTLLFGPSGRPVTLTAGQTFVEVLPIGYTLTIKPGVVSAPPSHRSFSLLPL